MPREITCGNVVERHYPNHKDFSFYHTHADDIATRAFLNFTSHSRTLGTPFQSYIDDSSTLLPSRTGELV